MKNTYFIIITLLTAVCLSSLVVAQEVPNLHEALNYLKTYKFGMNREPLEPILEAIKTTQNNSQKQEKLSKQLAEILPHCSIDGKRFIARQLVVIGTPSIVPNIEPLLKNKETVDIACRILEQIPGKEATQSLIKALQQKEINDADKIGLINSLGRRKDSSALDILSKHLDDSSAEVQKSAIMAIGSIGGKEAGTILWSWAKGKSTLDNPEVQSALLKIASQLSEESLDKNLALEIYSSLFDSEKVLPVGKGYALRGLVQLKGKDSFDWVWQSVFSEDKILSASAIDLLKDPSFSDTMLTEKCNSVLKTANPRIQLGLLEVIASRKLSSAVESVLDLVKNTEGEVQTSAIQCLGGIGDIKSIVALVDFVLNGSREISATAKDALIKLNNPDVDNYLIGQVQQGKPEIRKLAVDLLTERRIMEAKNIIKDAILKNDKDIFDESLNYMAVLGREEDLSILFDKLLSDTERSSNYVPVISLILDRLGEEGLKMSHIREQWKKCQNEAQKKSLISILGNIKSPESCAMLEDICMNEPALKISALQSLGQCVDANTLQKIVGGLEKENVAEVKSAGITSALNILRTLNLPDKQKFEYYSYLWNVAGENPGHQKNILGGLAKLSLLDVLNFIEGMKVNDALKADWINARVSVAKNIAFSYPSKVMPILEESLPVLKDKQAEEIKNLLNGLKNRGEILCAWSMSGPYRMEDYGARRLFDEVSFPPETDMNSVQDWRILPMKIDGKGLIYADLAEFTGGEVECVAYVACKIKTPESTEGKILLGSNDGVKVWLNGTLVHSFAEGRTMTPDEDQFTVKLEKENILLMAVYNQGAAWEFIAKLQGIDWNKITIEPYLP